MRAVIEIAKFWGWPQTCWLAAVAILSGGFALAPVAQTADSPSHERVSFYFAGHEDDWQLFMNPSAFQDVADPKTKAVFVHMTAGDAGNGTGTGGRKHPYYLARENGAELAIRFMADSPGHPTGKVASNLWFRGHPVYQVSYRNTAAYFLRLPDGNPEGSG